MITIVIILIHSPVYFVCGTLGWFHLLALLHIFSITNLVSVTEQSTVWFYVQTGYIGFTRLNIMTALLGIIIFRFLLSGSKIALNKHLLTDPLRVEIV